MKIEKVRDLFPHLKTGQIYFNHAAVGPWHQKVIGRLNEYVNQRAGNVSVNYETFLKYNDSAKKKLSQLIGTDNTRIAWIDNVSNAMSLVAQGLKWNNGDRIIINDVEFPANVYPFLNLKKHGVEIDIVKSRDGKVDLEDIEKVVTSKTKLVTLSLVQFLSGYRAGINAIGEYCKKNKIIFCVDAIQAAGAIEININKINADFLCGGTHKWLMSSQGVSYFFMSEELQSRIDQKYVGWTSVKNAWNFLDYKLDFLDDAEKFQNGTLNELGICLLDASLDLYMELVMQECETNILNNSEYFINKLSEIGIEPLLNGVDRKNLSGIVSFKSENSKELFIKLKQREIHCAVREGIIRFSPHFYNTIDEIDSVINVLKQIKS